MNLEAEVEPSIAEDLAARGTAEPEDFPAAKAGVAGELDTRRQTGVRTGEEQGLLREPLERRIRGDRSVLLDARLDTVAEVPARRGRRGDQRVRTAVDVDTQAQIVAADDARRR